MRRFSRFHGVRRLRTTRPMAMSLADDPRMLRPEETEDPFTRWVQVLKIGEQYTNRYDEPYTLDDDGAAHIVEVFDELTAKSVEFIFDLNHYSLEGGPTPEHEARTGTMKALEHREGEGVWALVEFTDDARDLIKGDKFRLVSPEIWDRFKDPETGEWIEGPVLAAAAMVERPALHGMEKIAARDLPPAKAKALAERFGQRDVFGVVHAVMDAVSRLADAGKFGPVPKPSDDPLEFVFSPVEILRVDPEWDGGIVVNHDTGVHYEFDIVEVSGELAVRNIRKGTLEFVPATEEKTMTLEEATARIEALEAEAAARKPLLDAVGTRTVEELMALFAATADLDAKGIAALRDVAPANVVALRESVNALSDRLDVSETARKAIEAQLAAAAEREQDHVARKLVEAGERAGKITPATREFYVGLAKRDANGFTAHLTQMPVVVHLREQGTANGGPDPDLEGESLHQATKAKHAEMLKINAKATYADALEVVSKERDDLVRSHSGNLPAAKVVPIR